MAALLITLSLLLWAPSCPYTTTTGKSGHHAAKIRSSANILGLFPHFFSIHLWKTFWACVPLSQLSAAFCLGRSAELQGKRREGARRSSGCQNTTQHSRPHSGQERWQHETRGGGAGAEPFPVPGWLCCSQHWYRKSALKKKSNQICHCCVRTFYLSTLKNLLNFQENVSPVEISV